MGIIRLNSAMNTLFPDLCTPTHAQKICTFLIEIILGTRAIQYVLTLIVSRTPNRHLLNFGLHWANVIRYFNFAIVYILPVS